MNLSVLSILFSVVLMAADADNRDDRDMTQKCLDQVGVTAEQYRAAMMKSSVNAGIDDKIKCVDACLLKELEIMKADGSVDGDRIVKLLTRNEDDEKDSRLRAIKMCATKRGGNECETAHALMACMNEEASKM